MNHRTYTVPCTYGWNDFHLYKDDRIIHFGFKKNGSFYICLDSKTNDSAPEWNNLKFYIATEGEMSIPPDLIHYMSASSHEDIICHLYVPINNRATP